VLKRIISIILLATVLLVACAPAAPSPEVIVETVIETVVVEVTPVPVDEGPEPVELLWWTEDCAYVPWEACEGWNDTYCGDGRITESGDIGPIYVEEWHKLYPEYAHVNVKCIIAGFGGGRIGTELTAMIRAGEGPNIYMLYGGRGWLAYKLGVNLDPYISDEAKADYLNYEQWFDEDGTVVMLPSSGVIEYPVANKQLIERACAQEGFDCEIPERWSIMSYDDYLEIAEAIKALDDGSYMGILFGMHASGQTWNMLYFTQAGLSPTEGGKFTGFAGGEDVLTELLRLYDEGYFYPDIAGASDDDAIRLFAPGKIGIFMARLSIGPSYIGPAVEAGECEPWDLIPLLGIQFREGVTPLIAGSQYGRVGFMSENTPEEHREAAMSFLSYVLSAPWMGESPGVNAMSGGDMFIPLHSMVERGIAAPGRDEAYAHIQEYGLADYGLQIPFYNDVRAAFGDMLSAVALHELTPEEALAQFQAKIVELEEEWNR